MKLGLQGTTVVVSSGDSGVGYVSRVYLARRMSLNCYQARGSNEANCLGKNGTIFTPGFPVTW